MGKDHLTVLIILIAVAVLPVLVWCFWRSLNTRRRRRAAQEMRHGNQVYGEWKRSQRNEPPPHSKDS